LLVCVIKVEQSEESEKKYNIFVLFHHHGTFHFTFSFSLDSWIILQGKGNVYTQFSLTFLPVNFYVALSDKFLAVISAIGAHGR